MRTRDRARRSRLPQLAARRTWLESVHGARNTVRVDHDLIVHLVPAVVAAVEYLLERRWSADRPARTVDEADDALANASRGTGNGLAESLRVAAQPVQVQ
jgi:hypothetical protein